MISKLSTVLINAVILQFAFASWGLFPPTECPTVTQEARESPYGKVISICPKETKMT